MKIVFVICIVSQLSDLLCSIELMKNAFSSNSILLFLKLVKSCFVYDSELPARGVIKQ